MNGDRAIAVARDPNEQPDTTEITAIAETAGYEVVGSLTQRRREDATFGVGRGAAEELARRATEREVDAVVYDGELDPGQTFSLGDILPVGTAVLDRRRLVLDVFAEQAASRTAELQVELARLRYELPRVETALAREKGSEVRANDEGPKRVVDLRERITRVEAELDELSQAAARRRRERRAEGFDLVALAGYTNAGKSTLLHRLADDLSVADRDPDHDDVDAEATVADRLFETLETTTRRATIDGRPALVTDTVGFAGDLPHDAIEAFRPTLEAVADADVGVVVADATDDPERLREKLSTALAAIADHEPEGERVVALNKVDAVDDDGLAKRRAVLDDLGVDPDELVTISALRDDGIETLRGRIADGLPTDRATLALPNDGETQRFLAWAHDSVAVEDVSYEGDRVVVTLTGRPGVLERARSRAPSVE